MSLYLLCGAGYNQLARMSTAATPESASTKYPIANLYDGIPNKPFVFSTAGGSGYVNFDLNQTVNGSFETAFTGGLPGTGWAKSAGATVTRENFASPDEGSWCLRVAGAGEYVTFDVDVASGEVLNLMASITTDLVGGDGSGRLKCRNLTTGSWLHLNFAWQASETACIVGVDETQWTLGTGSFTVEDYATSHADMVTLRFFFYNFSPAAFSQLDAFYLFPSLNFASIHGHNIPPSCAVTVKADFTTPATTTRATFTHAQPTMFATWSTTAYRYLRLSISPDPLVDAVQLGELVVGQYTTATRRQNYGQDLTLVDPQDRTQSDIGPLQAVLRTTRGRRQVAMQFRLLTEADYAQRKEILERSRNGAYPLVVVVESADVTSAIMGRVESSHRHTRVTNSIREDSLALDELPHMIVVA